MQAIYKSVITHQAWCRHLGRRRIKRPRAPRGAQRACQRGCQRGCCRVLLFLDAIGHLHIGIIVDAEAQQWLRYGGNALPTGHIGPAGEVASAFQLCLERITLCLALPLATPGKVAHRLGHHFARCSRGVAASLRCRVEHVITATSSDQVGAAAEGRAPTCRRACKVVYPLFTVGWKGLLVGVTQLRAVVIPKRTRPSPSVTIRGAIEHPPSRPTDPTFILLLPQYFA